LIIQRRNLHLFHPDGELIFDLSGPAVKIQETLYGDGDRALGELFGCLLVNQNAARHVALKLAGACFLLGLPAAKKRIHHIESAIHGLKEGVRYLRKDLTIMLILGATLLMFMLGMPYFSMLPVFVEDVLNVGASGMGILLTFNGIGAIFGSLALAWLPMRNRGRLFLLAMCFLSVAIVAFSFSATWYLSLGLMMIIGAGVSVFTTTANALLLHYTQQEYHGRIMSIFMMQIGFISLGTTVAGLMADSIGIQWAVGGLAMTLVVIAVTSFFFAGRVRRLQ
jgi:predicted MFS family arabinose efflux permease